MDFIYKKRIARVLIFIVLSIVAVVMLYPFYFMINTSFRSFQQYQTKIGHSLSSWIALFQNLPVGQELLNSAIVTIGAIVLILIVSTMGGYAFAKLQYKGRNTVFLIIISGMMIPMQSIIIPEYINISNLSLINNFFGAILVYAALGGPFSTFLMTTYLRGLPNELIEASLIDGLSYPKIFTRIILPLSLPAMATIVVLQFIQVWDDLLVAMLFLQSPSVRTITVGLATLQASRMTNIPVLMAGSLISAIPAVIVFLFFQKYLVTGLTMGVQK